jgi:methionyl-tRNA formyltransferase
LKLAFFGLPLGALLLHADGHTIVYAGICRDHALGTRRLARLLGNERVFVKPAVNEASTIARVRDASPDLVVSWFWTTRLPSALRALSPLGTVGVHPSLLPRHRGPDPYFWAIDAGDDVTGVTAHELAEEYDTGRILGQRTLAIDPAWNAWTLAKKLDRPSLTLLREVVRAYAEGKPPPPVVQDERAVTLAPEPNDDLLEIRWSASAAAIERRVRAAAPWPGAFTEIAGETVIITRARTTKDFPRALTPGEAAVRADGVAVVRSGDDALELLGGRSEGDAELGASDLAAFVVRARGM